jgi:phosphopantothenoylcysteine decarboxylase / phosphopantothenate---cysteine ligase
MSLSNKNILIGLSGSIAAYKVCELISMLKKQKANVKTIATPSALNFVGKATLEGLSENPVITSDFTDGQMMAHIQLAKWADLFLIAPASAQTINSLHSGVGSSPLISTYLAYDLKKPLLVAPAMNTQMLFHPTTQQSFKQLSSWGLRILPTGSGNLACGDVGEGRLLEPEILLKEIYETLFPTAKLSILITAGGTKIPIDSVRSITNTSTGRTGTLLADYLSQKNYAVDLLLSKEAEMPSVTQNVTRFETYTDLAKLLEEKLTKNKYDLVIHSAAVSDFAVESMDSKGKIPSGKSMVLHLYPTEKIIAKIKKWNNNCKLVGFKLTDTEDEESRSQSIRKLFSQSADWVIHNDLSQISEKSHRFHLYDPKKEVAHCDDKQQLGPLIEKSILKELL